MRVEDLASEQGVSPNYLAQILVELKAEGIARSMRGQDGGYFLGRPPGEITLRDVLRAVDHTVFDSPAFRHPGCPLELKRAWERLRQAVETAAAGITFQQLLESSDKEKMYYI